MNLRTIVVEFSIMFVILLNCSSTVKAAIQKNTIGGTAQLTTFCSYRPCCRSRGFRTSYTQAEARVCGYRCDGFRGCSKQGQFDYCGTSSHPYVSKNNIIKMHSTHGDMWKFQHKIIRVWQSSKYIDALVCSTCNDTFEGECKERAGPSGYLIEMEANTWARFRAMPGPVHWSCLNC